MNKFFRCILWAGFLLLLPVVDAIAALGETEGSITFRGDLRRIALPPVSVHAFAEGTSVSAAEGKRLLAPAMRDVARETPDAKSAFLALALEKSRAGSTARLSPSGLASSAAVFSLPAESGKLRRVLAGYARYAGLCALQGKGDFPGLKWTIHIHRLSHAGAGKAIAIDNNFWELVESMPADLRGGAKQYTKSALLTFSFANTSRENLYVYVINYTDDGQVLPVLPPEAKAALRNVAAYGQELVHPALRLELGAPVERVRLIVSRVPLTVAHWVQESFDADPAEFEHKGQVVKAEDWASAEVVFTRDN